MKRIFALLTLIFSLLILASCDDSELEVPAEMQLVYGSDSDGYYFFGPEAWLISNVGEIKSTYISRVNTTSVSFAEVKFECEGERSEYFFNHYFNDGLAELQKMPAFQLKESEKTISLGLAEHAAKRAEQYIYSYEYDGYTFTFMQILAENDGRFYILTYAAQSSAAEGEKSRYDNHLPEMQKVIENFRFVKADSPKEDLTEYERDADGYILVSDSKLSGFDLYVPESFKPSFSSAIALATHIDGSSINLTKATPSGITADKYWELRKSELEKFFGEVTEIQKDADTELGNSNSSLYGNWDWAYEYTYVHEGEKYHVYQILSIDGFDGYVFTYTALEDNYYLHFDEVLKVIEKVNFK